MTKLLDQRHGHRTELQRLQSQAAEIIAEILGECYPEEAEVRAQLRHHVQSYPGNPEKALLAHILAMQDADKDG